MASSIMVAEAEEVVSRPIPEAHGAASLARIETNVELRVVQSLKGEPTPREHLILSGGKVGDVGYLATWEPRFRPGERVIIFLDATGRVMGPEGKLLVRDGRVPALDASVADVLALVLGAEPLGPMAGERPAMSWAAATLPISNSTPPRSAARIMPAVTTLHVDDDFESGTIGAAWSLYDGGMGTDWEISTRRKVSGSYSVYCDDDAPSGGPYTTNSYSWLWAGPFDLSDATTAFLEYNVWLSVHTGDDLSVVFSTGDTNGDTYLDFNGFAYGSSSNMWVDESIDLGNVPITGEDLTGAPEVWIAFIFTSDGTSNTREGVYLDDVVLVEDPVVPVITDIDPASASAGTNSLVTITGTGFGATQGSGTIEFTYDELSGTTIEATATTWSDTEITCVVPIVTDPYAYPGAAGSGPVTITSAAGGTSAGYDFSVPFAYGGIKWPTLTVPYRFNANTSDTSSELTFYNAASTTWNSASVFEFEHVGSTTTNDYTNNGTNEVFWTNTALPSNVLAAAGIWYDDVSMRIEEVDVGFNDLNKLWGDGSGGSYDIHTIAVHELGHALNLRDLYGNGDTGKIMYGYGAPGGIKRALSTGDIAGIQWIYGSNSVTLQASVAPSRVVPGEDVLFTYTVTNNAPWPIYDVTLVDEFGQVSVTPTLTPGANLIETRTASYATVGTKTNNVTVTATGAGEPLAATATPSVEVALPALTLTVTPTDDPALYGSDVTLRYRLRNNGAFPLSSLEVVDPSRGVAIPVAGTLAVGATTTVNEVVTVAGPLVCQASASGHYSSYEASDTASAFVVSTYERISGNDRIATAVQASKRTFPSADSADTVVVASAFAWADALPAAGLAGAAEGPLLLVNPTSLPTAVRNEIVRLGADTVYIAGGSTVVSDGVKNAIDGIPGVAVVRLGGSNRYDTARLIAREMGRLPGVTIDTAFVATGLDFPDALAASSLAAAMPAPILLSETSRLPNETKAALSLVDPDSILVCGSTGTLSAGVQTALGAYGTVVRRGGSDRYQTAKLIVTWGEPRLAPSGPVGLYLAVGSNYPDALAGGVLAAKANGSWYPLMLTPGDTLSGQVSSYITSRPSVAHVGVLGGTTSVSASVLNSAKALLP